MSEENNDDFLANAKKLAESIRSGKEDISQDLEQTIEEAQKVIEALEAGKSDEVPEDIKEKSALQVTNESEIASKYLTPKAKGDMIRKANGTLFVEKDGSIYKAVYFSVLTKSSNVEKGVKVLSQAINQLSEGNLIHSTLAPISSFQLIKAPLKIPPLAIFTFVLVPVGAIASIKEQYKTIIAEEGGLGSALDDFNVELNDGEFLAEIHISHFELVKNKELVTLEQKVQSEVDQLLAVLPKGTEVKEITQCAIVSLSYPYEVKFYNPLMKRIKSVEVGYVRSLEKIDEQIKEFNLLTEVRYFDAERKQLFK